jgi:hypothetical protein
MQNGMAAPLRDGGTRRGEVALIYTVPNHKASTKILAKGTARNRLVYNEVL